MTSLKTFGISIEPSWPLDYSIRISKLAEKLQFSYVWVPDGGPSPPYSDTIVTLTAIAATTSKIKFGSSVVNFYTRNPASIASAFLALSDLGSRSRSNGRANMRNYQRAIVGIGVGSDWNLSRFGITNRHGVIEQLREAIESIQELFNGKEVTVRTDGFAIESVTLSKSPKKIPIYVGSNSPKGLRLSGEIADGVILTDRIPSDCEESLEHITLGLTSSSRTRRQFDVVNSVVMSLDGDKRKARRAVKPTCAYLVAWLSDGKARSHQIDLNVKAKISEFIRIGDEHSAAKLVDDKMIDLLTAAGDVDDCVSKCKEYLSQDLNQLAFCEPFGPDPEESISLIAKKVIPRL